MQKQLAAAHDTIVRLESERLTNDAAEAETEAAGVLVTAQPEKDLEAAKKQVAKLEEALEALNRRQESHARANGGKGPCTHHFDDRSRRSDDAG